MKKKLLTLLTGAVLMLALTTTALADAGESDFTVTTTDGTYTETTSTLTITAAGTYDITMDGVETTTNNITIDASITDDVTLNLNGVTMTGYIRIKSSVTGNVTINLNDTTIDSTNNYAINAESYTKTLTIGGSGSSITSANIDSSSSIGIYSSGDIEFINTGELTITGGSSSSYASYGVYATGADVTFSGTGKVTLQSTSAYEVSAGVRGMTVTIGEDADVKTTGGTSTSYNSYGVYATAGTYVNDNGEYNYDALIVYGTLTATGKDYGVYAAGFTVDGGSLTANSISDSSSSNKSYIKGGTVTAASGDDYRAAINCNGSLEISGGEVEATATGTEGKGISAGSLTISGGEVTASSTQNDGINSGTINISGGTVDASSDSGYGIGATTLTISGGTINATGTTSGIYATTSLSITDAKVTATATSESDNAAGIYSYANLSITDSKITASASATADGKWAIGINADSNLTIKNSTIEATATSTSNAAYGIYAGGKLSITGTDSDTDITSTATSTSGTAYGIYSGGDMAIDSSTIDANATSESGNAAGIYSYADLSIKDSKITGSASTAADDKWAICIKANVALSIESSTIDATATADDDNAYGIYTDGSLTFKGTNDNTYITLTATVTTSGTAYAVSYKGELSITEGLSVLAKTGTSYDQEVGTHPSGDYTTYFIDNGNYDTIATDIQIGNPPKTTTTNHTPSTYASVLADTENGTATLSGSKNTLNSTVTVETEADDGYELSSVIVTYSTGKEVTVTDNEDGSFTYKQPGASVTVTVTFVAIPVETEEISFSDIDDNDYYYDAVIWAAENNITTGKSDGSFAPCDINTRAEAVTFLYRVMGEPEHGVECDFTDIVENSFYFDAVLWAVEEEITLGTSDTTFSPDEYCTRAEIITFLWRMMGEPVVNSINLFTDVASDSYYYDAVLWATGSSITTGTSDTTFSPNEDCSRADIVTFLYRAFAE